jgi:hypothetical protein
MEAIKSQTKFQSKNPNKKYYLGGPMLEINTGLTKI